MIKKCLRRIVLGWIVLILVAALLGDVSVAASDVGRTSADFLQIGQGARAAGLGGAYTAISEGAIAAYWNPAGLASMESSEISLGHFSWFQDITVEQLSFAWPVISGEGSMAASVTYVNYGSIDGYDASGVATGDLTAYDLAGGLSFGYQLTDAFSAGVTAKYITQKLDEYSASAFAADFGLKYRFERFSIAAAVCNIGSDLKFDQQSENLPTAVKVGVAARPFDNAMVASFEVEKRVYGNYLIRQGVELGFSEHYYLRTGYDYLPAQDGRSLSTGISVGAGVDFDFARFDYAFTPNDKSTSEDLHRFSLVFRLGR